MEFDPRTETEFKFSSYFVSDRGTPKVSSVIIRFFISPQSLQPIYSARPTFHLWYLLLETLLEHWRLKMSKSPKSNTKLTTKNQKYIKLLWELICCFERGPRLPLNFSASQRCPWSEHLKHENWKGCKKDSLG